LRAELGIDSLGAEWFLAVTAVQSVLDDIPVSGLPLAPAHARILALGRTPYPPVVGVERVAAAVFNGAGTVLTLLTGEREVGTQRPSQFVGPG
jgi:hypothetical protein